MIDGITTSGEESADTSPAVTEQEDNWISKEFPDHRCVCKGYTGVEKEIG